MYPFIIYISSPFLHQLSVFLSSGFCLITGIIVLYKGIVLATSPELDLVEMCLLFVMTLAYAMLISFIIFLFWMWVFPIIIVYVILYYIRKRRKAKLFYKT